MYEWGNMAKYHTRLPMSYAEVHFTSKEGGRGQERL